jgi:hypothetical protein
MRQPVIDPEPRAVPMARAQDSISQQMLAWLSATALGGPVVPEV